MRCDVIVIGAGPAGSAAAAAAARDGLSVVVLDRALPPAPHLPESWSGATLPLLRTIGLEHVKSALRERTAVRYLTPTGRFGIEVTLARVDGCDEPSCVRLDRARFDELLIRNAVLQGAAFRPLHTVTEVDLEPPSGDVEVVCATPQGPARMPCQHVIDASGKSAQLAGQLGTRTPSPALDPRAAVFTHFRPDGAHRFAEADTMTVIGIEHGYVFVIPLEAGRVSVGVVVGEACASQFDGDLTALFWTQIDEVSVLVDFMAGAEQLLPIIPALNAELVAERFAGAGFALTGDAAAFTDPFYSTGIDFALRSGVLAGRAASTILAAAAADDAAARDAAADAYDGELRSLLADATRDGEYGRLARDANGDLLDALADPHLPTVLPLLGLLQRAGRGVGDAGAHRELVRMLRDDFDRPLSAERAG